MSAEEGKEGAALPARAFLGIGSNIEPRRNVTRALEMLAAADGIRMTGISTFYQTPALASPEPQPPNIGAPPNPNFLNGVLGIETSLEPDRLEELLAGIEDRLGRVRTPDSYAPRTMDLDLLLYLPGRQRGGAPDPVGPQASGPHPDVLTRAFVALPLLELAPDLLLPPKGEPLSLAAAAFSDPGGSQEAHLTSELRSRFLAR